MKDSNKRKREDEDILLSSDDELFPASIIENKKEKPATPIIEEELEATPIIDLDNKEILLPQKNKLTPTRTKAIIDLKNNLLIYKDNKAFLKDYPEYQILDQEFNFLNITEDKNTKFACIGGGFKREIILVNSNSDKFKELKKAISKIIFRKINYENQMSYEKSLIIINEFVKSLSPESRSLFFNKKFKEYIEQADVLTLDNNKFIQLDELIEKGLLVCRHNAIIAGILLSYCANSKNGWFKELHNIRNITRYRDNTKLGAHAWTVVNDNQDNIYIVDPTWRQVTKNFSNTLYENNTSFTDFINKQRNKDNSKQENLR